MSHPPAAGFDRHGIESPYDGAPPWAVEQGWALFYIRQQVDHNRAQLDWIRAELEGKHKLDITATGDVITTQPAPTAAGADQRPAQPQKETIMSKTLTIDLKATDIHTISLGLTSEADGSTVAIPAGDTFSATAPVPHYGVVIDNTADTMTITPLTLPGPGSASTTFPVTDSAGNVAMTVTVNYPVPVVDDITSTGDVVTQQAAPTAPGV